MNRCICWLFGSKTIDNSLNETRDLRLICRSLGSNFVTSTNSCQGEWGVNPLTKNNWVLDTCGSPRSKAGCDIYPEGESGIMSFCSIIIWYFTRKS